MLTAHKLHKLINFDISISCKAITTIKVSNESQSAERKNPSNQEYSILQSYCSELKERRFSTQAKVKGFHHH